MSSREHQTRSHSSIAPQKVSQSASVQPESLKPPQFFRSFVNIPLHSSNLTIGQPHDPAEQAADQIAEQIMRSTDVPPVQAKSIRPNPEPLAADLPLQSSVGRPLSGEVRSFMEPRFHADFSQVRVHTDDTAVQMNRDIGAQAFTHQNDIYFGAGYTATKDNLTAHELAHVVQQSGQPGLIQARFGWTRQNLEQQTGKKTFRSEEYKNIVRIVTQYQLAQNPLFDRIGALQELITACNAWLVKNAQKTSTKVRRRRQVIEQLKSDANQEIASLQQGQTFSMEPDSESPPRSSRQSLASSQDVESDDILGAYQNNFEQDQSAIVYNNNFEQDQSAIVYNNNFEQDQSAIVYNNNFEQADQETAPQKAFEQKEQSSSNPPDSADLSEDQSALEADSPEVTTDLSENDRELLSMGLKQDGEGGWTLDGKPVFLNDQISLLSQKITVEELRSQKQAKSALTDDQRLEQMGLKWDAGDELWFLDFTSVSNQEIQDLLSGRKTVDDLRNLGGEVEDSASEAESEDEEPPENQPKTLEAKAQKYRDRAQTLVNQKSLIQAAVQSTRAYKIIAVKDKDAASQDAFSAATQFDLGGDQERAIFWYRKVIELNRNADLVKQAKAKLGDRPEVAKYKTSEIWDIYTGVKQSQIEGTKPEKQAQKSSGLSQEELSSGVAAELLKDFVGQHVKGDLGYEALKVKVEKMATGFDADELIQEYKNYLLSGNNPNQPRPATPKFNQLKAMKVSYLNTTAQRNPFKLFFADGKIQQGDPKQAQTGDGYDTSNLSTNFAGKGFAIFAMSGDGEVYASQHKVSQFHHSSFLAASDAAASGEIKVQSGALKAMTNKSGHYRQGALYLCQALIELRDRFHQNLSGVQLKYHRTSSAVEWDGNAAGFVEDVTNSADIFKGFEAFTQDFPGTTAKDVLDSVKKRRKPQIAPPIENKPEQPKVDQKAAEPTNALAAKEPQVVKDGKTEVTTPNNLPAKPTASKIPADFIVGDQGLAIAPALKDAIRKDILALGMKSKWADEYEIRALATALDVQFKIINSPSGENIGSSGKVYQLRFNGRDHYDAYLPTSKPGQFEFRKIPGNGDCFYNAVSQIHTVLAKTNLSIPALRQKAHDQLTNRQIADMAIAVIRDFYKKQTTGIGENLIALLKTHSKDNPLYIEPS